MCRRVLKKSKISVTISRYDCDTIMKEYPKVKFYCRFPHGICMNWNFTRLFKWKKKERLKSLESEMRMWLSKTGPHIKEMCKRHQAHNLLKVNILLALQFYLYNNFCFSSCAVWEWTNLLHSLLPSYCKANYCNRTVLWSSETEKVVFTKCLLSPPSLESRTEESSVQERNSIRYHRTNYAAMLTEF